MDENATNAEEMQPPYVSLPICTIFPPPISKLMRQVWKCLCFESLYLPIVMVASATPNKRWDTDLCRFGGEIYLLRIDSGKKLQCNILRFLCFHTVCIVCGYNEHLNFTTSRSVATRAVFLQTKLIFQLYIFPLTAESRHKKTVLCVLRKSLPLSESVCLCTRDDQFIYIMCFY